MDKILILLLIATLSIGCAGLGLEKKATLIPDEIWASVDINPQDSVNISEVTIGIKYKLK